MAQEGGLKARARAWAVHAFTASGAVLGLLALLAAARGDYALSALWMLAALAVDGSDGLLARRFQVARFAPALDGRRLDDIVDYLNYVIVPVCFLVWSGHIESLWIAAAPVLASAYGFAQTEAKTRDHFFLGFPSYWNVVAIYLWQFQVGAVATGVVIVLLAALVFVPLRYLHPSQMHRLWWSTNLGAALWLGVVALAVAAPETAARLRLIECSLIYPVWYLGLSLWLGGLTRDRRTKASIT